MSAAPLSPDGTMRSQGTLRQHNTELEKVNQLNFDLKLQVHNLQKALANKDNEKRQSATPVPDNFYVFDDGTPRPLSSKPGDANFAANGSIIELLREQVMALRTEKEELDDSLRAVQDDLCASVARAETLQQEKEKIEQTVQVLIKENEELSCQVDEAASEGMVYKLRADQLQHDVDSSKAELRAERDNTDMARKLRSVMIRSEGLQLQYDATVAAVDAGKREIATLLKKLGQHAREAKRYAALSEERQDALLASQEECSEAVSRAREAGAETEALKRENEAMQLRLEKEQDRIDILMRSEQEVRKGEWLFSKNAEPLDEIVAELSERNSALTRNQSYRAEWRDEILQQMNGYLYVLHRSQLEVEERRREFLEQYCAAQSDRATANHETQTGVIKVPVMS